MLAIAQPPPEGGLESGCLWLIPVLPLAAAGIGALLGRRQRRIAAGLAIGSMLLALILSCRAFVEVLHRVGQGGVARQSFNFHWLQFGDTWLTLGVVLDPLTAVMLVMVSFVGLLIFIYSVGYMAHDENFARFFCFLSLFASAMLGVVIANSLLLLFICWELVGLTSYLLIGFWYHKPSAAAAAKKAFITTRIGDLAFLLGMVWLYSRAGTLLFYDAGRGCLEWTGLPASTGIALLIFCGAVGKSGQLPLHAWLPDAMEGPTPVSALIHAATMVAAGVFLVARVYPLMGTTSLTVVTWVGALTALFAATVAVAQTDIKRILAYSTVSQLGFMMLGLGVGGVAVGMFHLLTHAFFKALLFLGAGSVIHGCHEEQDIRRMGGLRRWMPVTFATYVAGMLALSGFPLIASGFWSKDEILHAAHAWTVSSWPFYLGLMAAFLTAFYMTRQVVYVFFGKSRLARDPAIKAGQGGALPARPMVERAASEPHESPRVMLVPLMILAVFAVLLGFAGTPAWPWLRAFLEGRPASFAFGPLLEPEALWLMGLSSLVALGGIGLGYWFYGRRPPVRTDEVDALARVQPEVFTLLEKQYFVDEIYQWSVVSFHAWWARLCVQLDEWVWDFVVHLLAYAAVGLSWLNRFLDEYVVNGVFDQGCRGLTRGGAGLSHLQNGRVQRYLRVIALAAAALIWFLLWGWGAA